MNDITYPHYEGEDGQTYILTGTGRASEEERRQTP